MAKRRAYEVSKELGIEVKDLMVIADKAGVIIKNHMSSIEEADMLAINRVIEEAKKTKVVEKRVGSSIIRRRRVRPSKNKKAEKQAKEAEREAAAKAEEETANQAADAPDEALEEQVQVEAETSSAKTSDAEVESPELEDAQKEDSAEEVSEPEAEITKDSEKPAEEISVSQTAEEKAVEDKSETAEETAETKSDDSITIAEELQEIKKAEEKGKDKQPAKKQAKADDSKQGAQTKEETQEDEKPKSKKKKSRKVRQISKIVKRIELEDLEPAAPPKPKGRPSRGGAPANKINYSGGKKNFSNDIIQPIIENPSSGSRKRRNDNPYADDGFNGGKKGRGTRKRHTIDNTYFDRQGRGKKKGRGGPSIQHKTNITTPKAIKRIIKIATETIVVGELAKRMGIKANELILKLLQMGLRANINQSIDLDTATLLANEFNYEVENAAFEEEQFLGHEEKDDDTDLSERPPIVTVMGHVDHGKTSILDYIRKTHVADGEAGGITQHIGAYIVRKESGNITFLDTPGHEAFTSMRARGAQVTDLVILVVAADDGVMPQTIEAINHSRAAGVPMIVAVNKIDKPNAKPEKVRNELMQHSVVPEELGGDVIIVNVSAKTGEGIGTLLEMVTLQAEVLELKANPDRKQAEAIVIEGKLDRGRGPVATVLVRQGTLNVGDFFVCGAQSSKIKAMIDDIGQRIETAGPSVPVEILGFNEVPDAGESFNTLQDEKQAKAIAQNRYLKKRETELAKTSRVSLEELVERVKAGDAKTLSLVIKGDVQGTVEALKESLKKQSTDEVKIDIISTGVGGITESDILFASASQALIIGFNVRPESKAQILAENEGIDIRLYSVIYDVLEDIEAAVQGLTAPTIREVILGNVEVRDTFTIPKVGMIAGCYVTDGKVARGNEIRLLRDNVVIYTGKVSSLRRFKDDVNEVASGYECGVGIENYNDIKIGDTIEFFTHVEEKPEVLKSKK